MASFGPVPTKRKEINALQNELQLKRPASHPQNPQICPQTDMSRGRGGDRGMVMGKGGG